MEHFQINLFSTPYFIAYSRLSLSTARVRRSCDAEKSKLVSVSGDSGTKKCSEAVVMLMVGSGGVCVWRESGVRRSVLLVRLDGIWLR
jgi:hypothetical protein